MPGALTLAATDERRYVFLNCYITPSAAELFVMQSIRLEHRGCKNTILSLSYVHQG